MHGLLIMSKRLGCGTATIKAATIKAKVRQHFPPTPGPDIGAHDFPPKKRLRFQKKEKKKKQEFKQLVLEVVPDGFLSRHGNGPILPAPGGDLKGAIELGRVHLAHANSTLRTHLSPHPHEYLLMAADIPSTYHTFVASDSGMKPLTGQSSWHPMRN